MVKRIVRLLLPYLFCIIFPILSVVLLSEMLLDSYREKIILEKKANIEQSFEEYQSRLAEIENIIYYVNDLDMIRQYVYSVLGNQKHIQENSEKIRDIFATLRTREEIAEMYLYDGKGDRIIAAGTMLNDATLFYEFYYQIDGYIPEEAVERLEKMSTFLEYHPVLTGSIDASNVEVMEISMQVPMGTYKYYMLQLVVSVKAEELFKDLYEVCGENGEFYVYDEADQLLFGHGTRYESLLGISEPLGFSGLQCGEEQIYGAVLHAADDSCKVKIYIPQLNGLNEISREKGYTLSLLIASVLFSLMLCAYFTMRNYRDIHSIMELFKDREENAAEFYDYHTIKINVDKLVNENMVYLEQMGVLKKEWFMNQLIHNDSRHIGSGSKTTDIKDHGNVVLCIRYEGSDYRKAVNENVTLKDFVKLYLMDFFDREIEVFDPSARETVCVIYCRDQESAEEAVRNVIRRLNSEIFLVKGSKILTGAGNYVDSIYGISESYNQAKAVIQYNKIAERNIMLYSEMQCFTEEYYYPKAFDEVLYNYVIAGKFEEAKELVKQIYEVNIEKNSRMLTTKALNKIKERLTNSLVSIAEKCDIPAEGLALQLDYEENMKAFFAQVYDAVYVISEAVGYRSKDISQNVSDRVMEYINENYTDSLLSVDQIAHELGFQKDYLSRLFKSEYGEKMSVVIERLRIEKACELLKHTDMIIVDISKAVGYNSDISFRRAFKKVTGLTPGEYKGIQEKTENK